MSTFLDPRTKINASKKKKNEIHVCKMGEIELQKTKAIKITQKLQKKRKLITCWVQRANLNSIKKFTRHKI